MPLTHGKSKKAFQHNLKAELSAGKPQKQALAIAYATQRRAKHEAHGGEVTDLHANHEAIHNHNPKLEAAHASERHPMHPHERMAKMIMRKRDKGYAKGGMVDEDTHEMGDHAGMDDHEDLDSPFMDSDRHNQAFLSHDEQEESFPGDHSSNEMGDPAESREEALKRRVKHAMRMHLSNLMGHGKEEDEGVF